MKDFQVIVRYTSPRPIAPMEPMAPASVGEATPKKSDPSTRNTRNSGGARYLTPCTRESLEKNFRPISLGRLGPISGVILVRIMT